MVWTSGPSNLWAYAFHAGAYNVHRCPSNWTLIRVLEDLGLVSTSLFTIALFFRWIAENIVVTCSWAESFPELVAAGDTEPDRDDDGDGDDGVCWGLARGALKVVVCGCLCCKTSLTTESFLYSWNLSIKRSAWDEKLLSVAAASKLDVDCPVRL